MLAMIVEKVSGKPLGRKNTLAYQRGKNEVSQQAFGDTTRDGRWIEADQRSTSAVLGDGGIDSNVEGLARWNRALREHALLSAAEMQAALPPVKVSGGAKTEDGTPTDYGFGWFLDPSSGRKGTWHSGTTTGFRTFIERFTDEELPSLFCAIATICSRAS